jgi:hypothetical protein
MENKKTFITLLTEAAAGYVLTLGLWNQPYLDIK